MSLSFGFNLLHWSKDEKKWEDKFKALSDEDKDFYHNGLCWVLMSVEISHVSKKTIPIIVFRHKLYPILTDKWQKKVENEQYLQKFIGYEVNVNAKTDREYFKKLIRSHMNLWSTQERKCMLPSKSNIEREFERYCLEIHGRDLHKEFPTLHTKLVKIIDSV